MAGQLIGDDFAWLDKLMSRALDAITEISDYEAEFVSQTADRLDRYGARTIFSEKQVNLAKRIEAKLDEAGAA